MRLLLIFILFVQLYTTVFGVQTVYISPFGSNQNPGTQEEPFLTLAYFNTGINVQMPNVLINIQDCTFLGNKNSAAFTVSTGPNVQYNITKSLISGGKYGLFSNLNSSTSLFAFGTTF